VWVVSPGPNHAVAEYRAVPSFRAIAGAAFGLRREATATPTPNSVPAATPPSAAGTVLPQRATPTRSTRREEDQTPRHNTGNTSQPCIIDDVGQYVSVSPGPTTAFVEYRSAGATSRKRREATESH
jgi:hypothetical protein